MKNILLVIACALISQAAPAQMTDEHETDSALIGDLLAKVPASNEADWKEYLAAIASLGEEGLVDMMSSLSGYGKKDNTQLEYALGGLSYYVSKSPVTSLRGLAVRSYTKALDRVRESGDKAFMIRQLAIIGAPEAVPHVAKYCEDEQLCGVAARALSSIGSPEAARSLLASLGESQGKCRISIVTALGDLRYKPAVGKLSALAGSEDPDLRKTVLYSLSKIGDPSSVDLLVNAARNVNYKYDVTDATASLLRHARRLMESGHMKLAAKIAGDLLNQEEMNARIAGLSLLVKIKGRKSLRWLIEAAEHPSPEYRAVALRYAEQLKDKKSVKHWVNRVNGGQTRDRAAIVEMLGRMKAEAALSTVYDLLNDNDQAVRRAAIKAAQQIAGANAIPRLLDRMRTGNDEDMAAVKSALLQIHGDTVRDRVSPILNSMPPKAKEVLTEVLNEKTATPSFEPFTLSEEEVAEGFRILFDGTNLDQWIGNTSGYVVKDGTITLEPDRGCCNLYTKDQFSDFEFRFEFRLWPGGNNGVGIRTPPHGDAAYVGMEIQILDNSADIYKDLHEYQYHGSVYGIIPAKRGFLKPVGEWNYEQIIAKGSRITVILNGEVIVDGDVIEASKNGTLDGREHPGIKNKTGHIGFLYHDTPIQFRNIRIKEL